MSKAGEAPGLAARHDGEEDEAFETGSSISGDSGDEGRFSDCAEDEGQEDPFAPPRQPVRSMNSGSFCDLSSMMTQLPVKKGLSKHYEGKSQSFSCLSEVRCLDDLRKKESPYKQKMMKSCKSHVALDEESEKSHHVPGPSSKGVAKKASGGSCANLARNNSKSMLYRPPPIPVNKTGYHP